ncbi:MAG: carbohydrate-binding family 9-like protein [Acidobacteria bacterium]|nr:carbohydrate-binding family 9-like protein [Acidobacteriota bacterium]MCA1627028.1 carbohydrate-binding family 9-like protein [Acidobacteriota bacterium]
MFAEYIETPVGVADFDNEAWQRCRPVTIAHEWSGEPAPVERHAEVRICWSDEALHVRFVGSQHEPLVVSAEPRTESKTLGLWDRDVCEIFIAPKANEPWRYFEFEASPAGEWVDLGIVVKPEGRQTDWEFKSGIRVAAEIEDTRIRVAMAIPWSESIPKPDKTDQWLVNLFRCVGPEAPERYLAWRPTKTPEPNFHVPEAFGPLHFS